MRRLLLVSTAIVSLAPLSQAFAQTTRNDTTTAAQLAADPQTSSGVQPGDGSIQDIVVTARRQNENLQRAALAIDAVTGNSLTQSNIVDARGITKLVPALTVTNGGGNNTSLYLRGVGNRTNNSYNDPAIAISYDGVYLAHPAALFGAAFYDLQRVEVLKGPQGILYGRNATGGAINVLPARPELGKSRMGFDVSVGNYSAVNASAFLNLPVGSDAAVRVAAARQYQTGLNRDGSDDRDVYSFRGQFLFEPTDSLKMRLGADYTHTGGIGTGGIYVGNYAPSPAGYIFTASPFDSSEGFTTPAANAYRSTLLAAPGFGFLTPINAQPYVDYKYYGVNGELSAKTSIGTFTLIPAYRKTKGSSSFIGAAFNTANNIENDDQASLEGRLAGTAGLIDYIVGGFYFHEISRANNEFNQEFVLPVSSYRQVTDSYAGFGQLTAHVSSRFRLIGGARYTHDRKDMNGIVNNFITFCGGLPPANLVPPASFAKGCAAPGALPRYPNFLNVPDTISYLVASGLIAPGATAQANPQVFPLLNGLGTILKTYNPVIAQRSFSRLTYKGSVEFDVGPKSLLYATVETGYRAGGLQLAEGRPNYNPEYLDAYSVGFKNRFFNNRVQLNIEAFYWKYRDQQITYFTVDASGTIINSNENAGRATIKGFDVDAIVKPMRNTTLSGKVQYLDTNYDDLHLFTASPRDNIGCPSSIVPGRLAGGQPVKDFNCSGNPLLYSPKWTVNLGAEQVVPVGGDLEVVGSVNTSYRTKQYGGFEYLAFELIPAYWQTDLNLTLRTADDKRSVGVFITNLENKRREVAPQLAPTNQAVSIFGPPRMYGVRLSGRF